MNNFDDSDSDDLVLDMTYVVNYSSKLLSDETNHINKIDEPVISSNEDTNTSQPEASKKKKCKLCGKNFKNNKGLRIHICKLHQNEFRETINTKYMNKRKGVAK